MLFHFPFLGQKTWKGSYRHRQCCYLCAAVAGYDEQQEDLSELLYTQWGRDAGYRSQFLDRSVSTFVFVAHLIPLGPCTPFHCLTFMFHACVTPLFEPRLTTTDEFIDVNGRTSLTRIPGFSPWRNFDLSDGRVPWGFQ